LNDLVFYTWEYSIKVLDLKYYFRRG
jgi:hypothetical protein